MLSQSPSKRVQPLGRLCVAALRRKDSCHDPCFGNLLFRHVSLNSDLCFVRCVAVPCPSAFRQKNPLQRLHHVLFHPLALGEVHPQVKLRGVVVLLGGFPIPLPGFSVSLR